MAEQEQVPQAERLTIEFAGDTPIYPSERGRWCRWDAHEAEVAALREERDLAIAHDRQPYPTAEAYEKVCAARTKWQERAETAQAALQVLAGGPKADPVSLDAALSLLAQVEEIAGEALATLKDQQVDEEACSGCGAPRHGDHDNACPTGKWKVEAEDCTPGTPCQCDDEGPWAAECLKNGCQGAGKKPAAQVDEAESSEGDPDPNFGKLTGSRCDSCDRQQRVGDEGWESNEGLDYCPDCWEEDDAQPTTGETPEASLRRPRCENCGHVGDRTFAKAHDGEWRDVMGANYGVAIAVLQCANCDGREFELVDCNPHSTTESEEER